MVELLIVFALILLAGPIMAFFALSRGAKAERSINELQVRLNTLELKFGQTTPERAVVIERPAKAVPQKPMVAVATPVAATVVPPPLPRATQKQAEPTIPKPAAKVPSIDWKAWLRRLHLCPPDKETNGEVGLAAWWTTRIGILLGVIAVVFLGVYVNRMTAPWVRFAELLGISGGVFAAGWSLQKRFGRFGDIVSSGGLAMLYFTAYASHGVAAVQITNEPLLGALLQLGALGLMLVWSDRKRDASLAAFGIGLGYVSCAFAASHGMPAMTLGGLTLLGIIGSILLAKRDWRMPFLVAIIGSYTGLLLFTFRQSDALTLSHLFTTSVALLASFSGALWSRLRLAERTLKWFHRVSLAQGSAASLVVLSGTLLLAPEQISAAYAVLFLVFAIHAVLAWRKVAFPTLFPAWTLKALTFLALFIVAEFEGPTRWLSLVAQSFAILWTMRDTPRRPLWLEAGFWVLWATSFGLFLNDSHGWQANDFLANDPRRWVSWTYLTVALLIATLYYRPWGKRESRTTQERFVGIAMAIAIAIGSCQSFLTAVPNLAPLLPLGILTIVFLFLARRLDSTLPLAPSVSLILLGHGQLWLSMTPSVSWSHQAFFVFGLSGLSYLVAYRVARSAGYSAIAAPVWVSLTTVSGWLLGSHASPDNLVAYGTFFAVCFLAATGCRYLLANEREHLRIAVLSCLGVALAWFGAVTFEAVAIPWSLFITVGVLLGLAKLVADRLLAAVMVAPALLAAAYYIVGPDGLPWSTFSDLTLGVGMTASLITGAWYLCKETKDTTRLCLDGLLQVAAVLVFFQGLSRHVDTSVLGIAIGATTLSLCLISKRLPFPTLPWATWLLPTVLLVLGGSHFSHPTAWITSALIFLAWRMAPKAKTTALWVSAVALLWTILNAAPDSISPVALIALMGVIYAAIYHYLNEDDTARVALVVGAVAALYGLAMVLNANSNEVRWILLVSVGLATQGWLLKAHVSQLYLWRDAVRTWGFGAASLLLLQVAVANPGFGMSAIATPCWGLASIGLFIGGLFGGLRAYRMIGLFGLLACVVRMFAVDIDDTFFRIIAFAVVAVVLLGVGFLYTRFRSWIEQQDATA